MTEALALLTEDVLAQEDLLETPANEVFCVICQDFLQNPVMSRRCQCQQGYCKQCITKWIDENHTPKCPMCRKSLSAKDLQPYRFAKVMMDRLMVKCRFGCRWKGQFSQRRVHYQSCSIAALRKDEAAILEKLNRYQSRALSARSMENLEKLHALLDKLRRKINRELGAHSASSSSSSKRSRTLSGTSPGPKTKLHAGPRETSTSAVLPAAGGKVEAVAAPSETQRPEHERRPCSAWDELQYLLAKEERGLRKLAEIQDEAAEAPDNLNLQEDLENFRAYVDQMRLHVRDAEAKCLALPAPRISAAATSASSTAWTSEATTSQQADWQGEEEGNVEGQREAEFEQPAEAAIKVEGGAEVEAEVPQEHQEEDLSFQQSEVKQEAPVAEGDAHEYQQEQAAGGQSTEWAEDWVPASSPSPPEDPHDMGTVAIAHPKADSSMPMQPPTSWPSTALSLVAPSPSPPPPGPMWDQQPKAAAPWPKRPLRPHLPEQPSWEQHGEQLPSNMSQQHWPKGRPPSWQQVPKSGFQQPPGWGHQFPNSRPPQPMYPRGPTGWQNGNWGMSNHRPPQPQHHFAQQGTFVGPNGHGRPPTFHHNNNNNYNNNVPNPNGGTMPGMPGPSGQSQNQNQKKGRRNKQNKQQEAKASAPAPAASSSAAAGGPSGTWGGDGEAAKTKPGKPTKHLHVYEEPDGTRHTFRKPEAREFTRNTGKELKRLFEVKRIQRGGREISSDED
mmetsp:Transcript_49104/g.104526  ORF Transcript_49104/g.104526 Transcript_49104/m.104526 type:complete len:728 (+) Transcript_49104:88-2271(+)